MIRPLAFLFMIFFLGYSIFAYAVNPDEVLDNPELEARARLISAQLRCLVCQNESIDESHADLARDLRLLVRKKLTEGKSDQDIMDYLVSRYGDFILLKPRLGLKNIFLWVSPFLFLTSGAILIFFKYRNRHDEEVVNSLSKEEKNNLKQLLNR